MDPSGWHRHGMSARLSLVALIALLAAPRATPLEHRDQHDGWRLELPAGWTRVPDDVLETHAAELRRQTGKPISYAVAYQAEPRADALVYPYLLVAVHRAGRRSLEQVAKQMGSERLRAAARDAGAKLDHPVSADLDRPVIDERRRAILMNTTLDVADLGRVRVVVALFPGRDVTVQLNFAAEERTFDRDLPLFLGSIDTFHFDEGRGYMPKRDHDGFGLILIVVGLVGFVMRKARRSSTGSPSTG